MLSDIIDNPAAFTVTYREEGMSHRNLDRVAGTSPSLLLPVARPGKPACALEMA